MIKLSQFQQKQDKDGINNLSKTIKRMEENNAGINKMGIIIDIRTTPEAEKIQASSSQVKLVIFLAEIIG